MATRGCLLPVRLDPVVGRYAPLGRVIKRYATLDARRQLLLPVSDNYFCRRRVSKGVSPTTWRLSVVVVGRSVAVKDVSAGAPAGAYLREEERLREQGADIRGVVLE